MFGVLLLIFFVHLFPGGGAVALSSSLPLFRDASGFAVLDCGREVFGSFGWSILDHEEFLDIFFVMDDRIDV